MAPVVRAVSAADIARAVSAMKGETLDQKVTPTLKNGIEKWGKKVLADLGAEASFDLRNPLVADYLDGWREQKIKGITATARDRVSSLLEDAVAGGDGIDVIRRKLRAEFEEMTRGKAETIARTEVIGSSNAANLAAYQLSGLVDGKEWLAVQDDATRESHSELDGQRRSIRDAFDSPSGAKAQGPGLFGIPGEDINCRCTVRPVIADAASPAGEERALEWRAYIDKLGSFENEIHSSVAKAFGAWLGDVVSALG